VLSSVMTVTFSVELVDIRSWKDPRDPAFRTGVIAVRVGIEQMVPA
jgi:hypothetical protein